MQMCGGRVANEQMERKTTTNCRLKWHLEANPVTMQDFLLHLLHFGKRTRESGTSESREGQFWKHCCWSCFSDLGHSHLFPSHQVQGQPCLASHAQWLFPQSLFRCFSLTNPYFLICQRPGCVCSLLWRRACPYSWNALSCYEAFR